MGEPVMQGLPQRRSRLRKVKAGKNLCMIGDPIPWQRKCCQDLVYAQSDALSDM